MKIADISRLETVELYQLALTYQAQFHGDEDRRLIQSVSFWSEIKTVLDVGCGPGAFYEAIEPYLQDKIFLGIDVEPKFVEVANKKSTKKEHTGQEASAR